MKRTCLYGLLIGLLQFPAHMGYANDVLESYLEKNPPQNRLRILLQSETHAISAVKRADIFADFVIRSLTTYTPNTIRASYAAVEVVMSEKLRKETAPFVQEKIKKAEQGNRSAMFAPNYNTKPEVRHIQRDGEQYFSVRQKGRMKLMVKNTVAAEVAVSITVGLHQVAITPANPYGFIVTEYIESITE